jgi:hypothetical protein
MGMNRFAIFSKDHAYLKSERARSTKDVTFNKNREIGKSRPRTRREYRRVTHNF